MEGYIIEKNNLDLSTIPVELQLILNLLKYDCLEKNFFIASIDWNLFIQLTMHHRLYPVLYNKLKEFDDHMLPTYVIEALYSEYKRNTFQMLHFSAEMEQVSKLFSDNQIKTLFLKGPTLGYDLYGDISFRTSSDLDVLIPIEELSLAEHLLLDQGYEKDDYFQSVLNDWKWRHHHITFVHPEKRVKLEIHWRLHPGPGKEPLFAELWSGKKRSMLTTYPVYTLNNEYLFLFLISHGARHGWSRLRWLLDIHQLINQGVNFQEVVRLLKKYRLSQIGGQSLILSSRLFGTEISNELGVLKTNKSGKLAKEALFYFETMVNLHTDPVPEEVSLFHKSHLFSLMSVHQKTLFIISFLYPYPEDAETFPLPTELHFLYFPLRPFLWAWRKARKNAFS